ncbi:hypothetical protein [Rhizobium sp. NXC24]|uniref:hypothetical protein n=1 Tax=Rhizobium sp. NXC24 TaxID=2048897 RepID=UPI000CDF4126|nr:hypothetical protein [Rhizobium sp. NXC24]AVA20684.1 hypothetical protein NXC24_CH01017 [Rhizobium sp. NXC24]
MKRFLLAVVACISISNTALAQYAAVCNRQANTIGQGIANDVARRINEVYRYDIPEDERQALILLHIRARDRAFAAVEQLRMQCTARYIPMQNMANLVVRTYSLGLSEFLPRQMTYVDVSEIVNGRPLGGPNAAIPKAREDALRNLHIGGDAAKIVRDPKQILPWNW